LVESLRSNPPQKLCAFEKASSLQTEGHAKLPRNLHVDDGGETRSMSVKRIAYTRFRSLFEIFFSCRKSCSTAPGARERRLLKGLEDERHRGISQKNSISGTTERLMMGLFHERRPELILGSDLSAFPGDITPLVYMRSSDRSRTMSGSSHSGFTWNEVAEVLRVSQESNVAIFLREIKSQRKGSIRTKRAPVGTNDAQRTSNQPQFRRPGASR